MLLDPRSSDVPGRGGKASGAGRETGGRGRSPATGSQQETPQANGKARRSLRSSVASLRNSSSYQ